MTSRPSFADITAPVPPSQFLAEHWTRKAVLLRVEGRTFDRYFDWSAIEAILNAGDIAFPKIKLSRSDSPVPLEQFTVAAGGQRLVDGRAVLDLFGEGVSFGITGADSHWPPLRAIVDCLHDALLESVHTNVYCSPPKTQGFQCHFDLHEVFVLQLQGEKHWRVYAPTTEAPVSSWKAEDSPHQSTAPYLDVVLRPGDVLYVPRGHWHYAVACDSTSLHVTVGITCRKGSAFLDWLSADLTREDAWRRNVPLLASATEGGTLVPPAAIRSWGDELRNSMIAKLQEPDLFDRFTRDTLDAAPAVHNATILEALGDIEQVCFERPAGRRHYVNELDDAADGSMTITVAGNEIELDRSSAALACKVLEADAFTMADLRRWLPDLVTSDAEALLLEFTRAGLLNVRRV